MEPSQIVLLLCPMKARQGGVLALTDEEILAAIEYSPIVRPYVTNADPRGTMWDRFLDASTSSSRRADCSSAEYVVRDSSYLSDTETNVWDQWRVRIQPRPVAFDEDVGWWDN